MVLFHPFGKAGSELVAGLVKVVVGVEKVEEALLGDGVLIREASPDLVDGGGLCRGHHVAQGREDGKRSPVRLDFGWKDLGDPSRQQIH